MCDGKAKEDIVSGSSFFLHPSLFKLPVHWSSSGHDSAPVMRRRGFESHPVLWLFDNLVIAKRAHDVAAACRLAMADVRVRLPLGALARLET